VLNIPLIKYFAYDVTFCVNLAHLRTFILRYTNVLIIITRTVQLVATSPIAITSIRQLLSSCCYLFTIL